MYQPKVNNTQKYSDSQGEHIIHKGKLIKIRIYSDFREGDLILKQFNKPENEIGITDKAIRPIIISETEDIHEGDMIYDSSKKEVREYKGESIPAGVVTSYKILSLPEHFSDKHLQAIVDGKMKDGDEVLIKCEAIKKMTDKAPNGFNYGTWIYVGGYKIYLDQQNRITLFPAKQSLEEAASEFYATQEEDWIENKWYVYNKDVLKIFKAGAEWAKKNNY